MMQASPWMRHNRLRTTIQQLVDQTKVYRGRTVFSDCSFVMSVTLVLPALGAPQSNADMELIKRGEDRRLVESI